MPKSDFPYQQIRKDLESIRAAADDLYALSQHFFAVGNEQVGCKLQHISNVLEDSQEGINNAVGEWIMQDFGNARQASANMIKAMLAVTKDD